MPDIAWADYWHEPEQDTPAEKRAEYLELCARLGIEPLNPQGPDPQTVVLGPEAVASGANSLAIGHDAYAVLAAPQHPIIPQEVLEKAGEGARLTLELLGRLGLEPIDGETFEMGEW